MRYEIDEYVYTVRSEGRACYTGYRNTEEAQQMDSRVMSLCLYCRNYSIPYIELINIRFSDLKD